MTRHSRGLVFAVAVVSAAALGACSKPAPEKQPAIPPETSVQDLLGYAPADAHTAIVMPSFAAFETQVEQLAKRIAPAGAELAAMRDEYMDALAQELGVPDAGSLTQLITAKGVDSSKAIAIYLGPLRPEANPPEDSVEEDEAASKAEESSSSPPSAAQADESPTPPPSAAADAWALADTVGMAVAVHVDDAEAAEASLHELFATHPGWNADAGTEADAAGGVHRTSTGHTYAFHEGRLVVANDPAFLKQWLARQGDPAPVRYGTAECPAPSENAIVGLIRLDKMTDPRLAFLETLLEETGQPPETLFGSDPLVLNFTVEDDRFEVLGRVDMAKHDELRRTLGRPTPLRLAPTLPEHSLGLVSLRFNDEAKKLMLTIMGRLLLENSGDASGMRMAQQILTQFTGIVDDEVTVALTGGEGDEPNLVTMLAIDNRDQLNSLLSMAPGKVHETFENVEVKSLPMFTHAGSPLYYAIASNTLVLGNVLEEVKGCVRRLLAGERTGILASFDPPVEPGLPRYGAAFVKAEVLEQFDVPVLTQSQQESGLNLVLAGVRDEAESMRLTADMEDTWLHIRLGFLLESAAGAED